MCVEPPVRCARALALPLVAVFVLASTVPFTAAAQRESGAGVGHEALPVDQLLLYSGIKNGAAIHAERTAGAGRAKPKVFTFRSNMQPDENVSLFRRHVEQMYRGARIKDI